MEKIDFIYLIELKDQKVNLNTPSLCFLYAFMHFLAEACPTGKASEKVVENAAEKIKAEATEKSLFKPTTFH